MATSYIFNNKKVVIPGAYSDIKSGIKNPALALEFGNTLVIDTGSGKFFGGGSGISGEFKSGKDAITTFDNVADAQAFLGGGLWWLLSSPMFVPGGNAAQGISSLTYIKAATTTAAQINLAFTNGSLGIKTKIEGYAGRGVEGDETRATSLVTITAAGAANDTISISIAGEIVATYTVIGGSPTIAQAVSGLVASIAQIGLSEVVSSTSTTLTIKAPRGKGAYVTAPTIIVTGTVAGNAAAFAGGVDGTLLTRGVAARLIAGESDPTKYILQFYRGSFKGTDEAISDGRPYDNVPEILTIPTLLVESVEFSTLAEFIAWANADFTFNKYFNLASSTITTTGAVVVGDLTTLAGNNLATGGTEVYSTTALDDVLDSISDLPYDFIIADNWGANARSANNLRILSYIISEAKVKPDMYVAGGKDVSKWNADSTSSVQLARAYNSQYVKLVHGGVGLTDANSPSGFKLYDTIYKVADILGHEAGQAPQIPLTFKSIGIQKELHILKDKDVKLGLDAGVLMSRLDGASFDIIKGVNTLQANKSLVNGDGTSHSAQIVRIARQINKELVFNAKEQLLKKADGTNRNTLSAEDVRNFVEGYLLGITATVGDDNLIVSHKEVVVSVVGDAYFVSYKFQPNFEVSFLFFTGFIIDPNA